MKTRNMLSLSGVDPETIYACYRSDWKNSLPFCLYRDGEVIGVAKLSKTANSAYLSCVVIRDDLQGKGIGTQLVQYALALAKLGGFKRVYLEVRKDNKRGIAFFKKLGFEICQEGEYTYTMEREV